MPVSKGRGRGHASTGSGSQPFSFHGPGTDPSEGQAGTSIPTEAPKTAVSPRSRREGGSGFGFDEEAYSSQNGAPVAGSNKASASEVNKLRAQLEAMQAENDMMKEELLDCKVKILESGVHNVSLGSAVMNETPDEPDRGLVDSLREEVNEVRQELYEKKQELFELKEAYHELHDKFESRIGRAGDAVLVRKQMEHKEAEWVREKAELMTELARAHKRMSLTEATAAQRFEHHEDDPNARVSAASVMVDFAAHMLALPPDLESPACIEGYRILFAWCKASWATKDFKCCVAGGVRALARGNADIKHTLIFCGVLEAMIKIIEVHALDTPQPAPSRSPSVTSSRRPSSSPSATKGFTTPCQSTTRSGRESAVGGSPAPSHEWGEAVGSSTSGSVLEQAVASLSNLACKHQPSRAEIAESGGVQALLFVLEQSGDVGAQEKACTALGNLACSSNVKAIIGRDGGLEVLVKVVGAQRGDDVLLEACRALRNLANQNDANCRKIAYYGGIEALGDVCNNSMHPGVVTQAVAALSNLSSESATRAEMRNKLRWDAEWGTRVLAQLAKRTEKAHKQQNQGAHRSASMLEVDADDIITNLKASFKHSPAQARARATPKAGAPSPGSRAGRPSPGS